MSSSNSNSPPPAGVQGRRRSSGARFAALEAHKRDPNNTEAAARRLSFSEQRVGKVGFLGQMWNNFTRGPIQLPEQKGQATDKLPAGQPGKVPGTDGRSV